MELHDFISAAAKEEVLLEALQNQPLSAEQMATIEEAGSLKDKVIAVLKTVHDPEIPVNMWDLGLIYRVEADDAAGKVNVDMTLTAPTCPVAGAIPEEVKHRIRMLLGEDLTVTVNLVWQPKWDKSMMSDEAKLQLDMW